MKLHLQCWFRIKPLPVVAKILGGDLIFASNQEDLEVSATSSYNPNYRDGKNLKYKWTCLSSTNSELCKNANSKGKYKAQYYKGNKNSPLYFTFYLSWFIFC